MRALTSLAETVTDTYQYDAFGNVIASTGTTANNYLFSGEPLDSAVGLYYLRARYYRPATGRFWTADPFGGTTHDPLTLSKYVYTRNNPANRIDPTGRDDAAEYTSVTFSEQAGETHGFRHFACTLLSETAIIDAITEAVLQVANSGGNIGGECWGIVQVDYQDIIFRAFPRAGTGCINIGAYHLP